MFNVPMPSKGRRLLLNYSFMSHCIRHINLCLSITAIGLKVLKNLPIPRTEKLQIRTIINDLTMRELLPNFENTRGFLNYSIKQHMCIHKTWNPRLKFILTLVKTQKRDPASWPSSYTIRDVKTINSGTKTKKRTTNVCRQHKKEYKVSSRMKGLSSVSCNIRTGFGKCSLGTDPVIMLMRH